MNSKELAKILHDAIEICQADADPVDVYQFYKGSNDYTYVAIEGAVNLENVASTILEVLKDKDGMDNECGETPKKSV